jgi:hypothetical protein
MTDAHSGLIILALNSGSSSLKFGLYSVSASRTEAPWRPCRNGSWR